MNRQCNDFTAQVLFWLDADPEVANRAHVTTVEHLEAFVPAGFALDPVNFKSTIRTLGLVVAETLMTASPVVSDFMYEGLLGEALKAVEWDIVAKKLIDDIERWNREKPTAANGAPIPWEDWRPPESVSAAVKEFAKPEPAFCIQCNEECGTFDELGNAPLFCESCYAAGHR